MTKVGDILLAPEIGWQRIEDTSPIFSYDSGYVETISALASGGTYRSNFKTPNAKIKFSFKGSRIRIIGSKTNVSSSVVKISIDGVINTFSLHSSTAINQCVVYENLNISNGSHAVEIWTELPEFVLFDAIDVNSPVNKILISLDDGEIRSIAKGGLTNIIPKMSNYSSGGYTISAGSEGGGGESWKAFDGNDATDWTTMSLGSNPTAGKWVKIQLPSPIKIDKYFIKGSSISTNYNLKNWTFEGSDNGSDWTVLDTCTNVIDWTLKGLKEFSVDTMESYKYYQINPTANVNSPNYYSFSEFGLLVKNENMLYSLNDKSEQNFINHGMDKPFELDMTTVFTQREIIKTDGSSTIINVEPFTLADEFEGKQVKILEYTDNTSQVESVVETETEPYSIYDEFGDTMEVLYYTDDPDKSKAELEITANYSPLDEIDEDFEVVTWTDTLEEATETLVPALTNDVVDGGSVYATEIDLTDVVKVK